MTIGSNSNAVDHTGFPAVPRYDLCTGWGTPNGRNLLYGLALPQLLQIIPGTEVIASGPPAGPFTQTAASYALTNIGSVPLNWALGSTAAWLDVSATNGTLMPAAPSATISFNLNSEAGNLPLGSYGANLWFTNLNDGRRHLDLGHQLRRRHKPGESGHCVARAGKPHVLSADALNSASPTRPDDRVESQLSCAFPLGI